MDTLWLAGCGRFLHLHLCILLDFALKAMWYIWFSCSPFGDVQFCKCISYKVQRAHNTSKQYETSKLKVPQMKEKFSIELKNGFSIRIQWHMKQLQNSIHRNSIQHPRAKEKEEPRMDQCRELEWWRKMREWRIKPNNNTVMRKDKRSWLDKLASNAETAANNGRESTTLQRPSVRKLLTKVGAR